MNFCCLLGGCFRLIFFFSAKEQLLRIFMIILFFNQRVVMYPINAGNTLLFFEIKIYYFFSSAAFFVEREKKLALFECNKQQTHTATLIFDLVILRKIKNYSSFVFVRRTTQMNGYFSVALYMKIKMYNQYWTPFLQTDLFQTIFCQI